MRGRCREKPVKSLYIFTVSIQSTFYVTEHVIGANAASYLGIRVRPGRGKRYAEMVTYRSMAWAWFRSYRLLGIIGIMIPHALQLYDEQSSRHVASNIKTISTVFTMYLTLHVLPVRSPDVLLLAQK